MKPDFEGSGHAVASSELNSHSNSERIELHLDVAPSNLTEPVGRAPPPPAAEIYVHLQAINIMT